MKVALFSVRDYERKMFEQANVALHELHFIQARLTPLTAPAAKGCRAVCCFANDQINAAVLAEFAALGVGLICLRSAGYNHVDLEAARRFKIPVVRVPNYSPYAVAEHAVALLLSLNRKVHKAFNRVRELNFALDGLVGFDLHGKTVGIIGGGRIGNVFAHIMAGFGCSILVFDKERDAKLSEIAKYVSLEELLRSSDVVSLHVPLMPETLHLLNAERLALMKPNAILINTGRGALVDTRAMISALKLKKIGGACLDVYEEEDGVFFRDMSAAGIDDDILARLLTFPNVLVTAHQGFLTTEALREIARATMENITHFEIGRALNNQVT